MELKPVILFILLFPYALLSQTIKPIGTGLEEFENDFRFPSINIEKLGDDYFITGDFDLADSVPCKNAAILKFKNNIPEFSQAGSGMEHVPRYLFKFQNNLYIIQKANFIQNLRKWNGDHWNEVILGGYLDLNGYFIDQNKLYLYGNKLKKIDEIDYEIVYLENGIWKGFDVKWETIWHSYTIDAFAVFRGKYYINTSRGLFEIDSIGNRIAEIELDEKYSHHESKFYVVDDNLFLSTRRDGVFKMNDNHTFKKVLDVDVSTGNMFMIGSDLYFGILNEGTYIWRNDSFEYETYLQIYDVEYVGNNEYIIVGNFNISPDFKTKLNNIARLTIEKPVINPGQITKSICENEYIAFHTDVSDMSLQMNWKFPNGVPSYSNHRVPVVKFPNPGLHEVSVSGISRFGTSDEQKITIMVGDGCKVEREDQYDNVWLNGYGSNYDDHISGIDFSNGDATAVAFNATCEFWGISNSMSDKYGNLLYYTNGNYLFNSNHEIVKGSEDFNTDNWIMKYGYESNSAHQNILSLPSSQNEDIYFLIHAPIDILDIPGSTFPTKLYLSVLKETRDSNIIEMVSKRILMVFDTLTNFCMQAHKHCNGDDWWIIAPKLNSKNYYKILLKADGSFIVDDANLGIPTFSPMQSVFSPNGQFFVMTNDNDNEAYIWDFNACNGELSNIKIIKQDTISGRDKAMGCAFSPNSRYLYISSYHYLRQYDLCEDNFENSPDLIGEWDGSYEWVYPYSFARMMLAPNNKIYSVSYGASTFSMSTIHNPDEEGNQSNFKIRDFKVLDFTRLAINVVPSQPNFRYNSRSLDCVVKNQNIFSQEIEIGIYPNPSDDFIFIENYLSTEVSAVFIDNSGKIVKSLNLKTGSNFVNLSHFTPGIYYISYKYNNKYIAYKLVKI